MADIFEDILLANPLEIKTPRLKIIEANYSHELEIDKSAQLDFVRLANLTKHDEQAFPSLAHSMVGKIIQVDRTSGLSHCSVGVLGF